MSDLGDQGLASAWVDVEGLLEVPAVKKEFPGDVTAQLGKGSVAMTLRARSDAVELVTAADGLPKNYDTDPIDIGSLPASTALAIGIRAPAQAVSDQWDAAIEGMDDRRGPGRAVQGLRVRHRDPAPRGPGDVVLRRLHPRGG